MFPSRIKIRAQHIGVRTAGEPSTPSQFGRVFRLAWRCYCSFSQIRVTTLILPSLAKGAGWVI
jgi:hypothetical protein